MSKMTDEQADIAIQFGKNIKHLRGDMDAFSFFSTLSSVLCVEAIKAGYNRGNIIQCFIHTFDTMKEMLDNGDDIYKDE